MLQNIVTVGTQVIILFILILTGFVCAKKNILTQDAITSIVRLVLFVVTPCVILDSFNRAFDAAMLKNLGITALCAIGTHLLAITIAQFLVHDKDATKQTVCRFAVVFSNCGYMSLPLQNALLGAEGVFYGAVYVAVFNVFMWSYGFCTMQGSSQGISIKKIILTPGILGVAIGMIIFVSPVKLPVVLAKPISYFAALNTPMPMLVIGFYLASLPSLKILKNATLCFAIFLRLLLVPFLALGACYLFGVRGAILVVVAIASSAPSAANSVMFSTMFKRDASLAGALVTLSTLFSVITMPLVVSLALYLAQL